VFPFRNPRSYRKTVPFRILLSKAVQSPSAKGNVSLSFPNRVGMAVESASIAPRAKRPASFVLVLAFLVSVPVLKRVHETTRKRWWRSEGVPRPSQPTKRTAKVDEMDVSKHEEEKIEARCEHVKGRSRSWTCSSASSKARTQLLHLGHAALALLSTFLTAVFVLCSLAQLSTHHVIVTH